ncbi:unnamed protein product [Lampetra planeri]
MATLEKRSEALSVEHRNDHSSDSSPPGGRERRTFRSHLVGLLEAVAAIVAESQQWRREHRSCTGRASRHLFPPAGNLRGVARANGHQI